MQASLPLRARGSVFRPRPNAPRARLTSRARNVTAMARLNLRGEGGFWKQAASTAAASLAAALIVSNGFDADEKASDCLNGPAARTAKAVWCHGSSPQHQRAVQTKSRRRAHAHTRRTFFKHVLHPLLHASFARHNASRTHATTHTTQALQPAHAAEVMEARPKVDSGAYAQELAAIVESRGKFFNTLNSSPALEVRRAFVNWRLSLGRFRRQVIPMVHLSRAAIDHLFEV